MPSSFNEVNGMAECTKEELPFHSGHNTKLQPLCFVLVLMMLMWRRKSWKIFDECYIWARRSGVTTHNDGTLEGGLHNRCNKREKMSVSSVICYNHGVLRANPIHGSFNRVQFNYGVTQYFLSLIEHDSFLVMDNASIYNEQELRNILAPKNITLAKLPPYSYNLNPLEFVLGIIKAYARRWPDLVRPNSFSQMSVNSVMNCYRKCWQVST